MDMFRGLKTFLFNHRRKFLISGIAVGGGVALFHYLQHQQEKRQKYEISEILENIRREGHFATIQSTCDQTVVTLCKQLEKQIISILNIDRIVDDLKKSSPKSLELWENLKISTFTQICLLVYGETLLVFSLKIQFAIIGSYMYTHLNENNEQMNRCLQEKYLSLCIDFIKNGLLDLYEFIRIKVTNVVSGLDLQKKLTLQGLQDIFWSIQASVDSGEFIDDLSTYLRVETKIADCEDPLLKKIYEETLEIFSTKELTSVCINSLLHCGFTTVMGQLAKHCRASNKSSTEPMPTAKLLPLLHNVIKLNSQETQPSKWSQNLKDAEKLKVLAANVYESYC